MADIVGTYQSGQIAWSLEDNTIIEHLYLYLGTLDIVCSVTATIDHHLLYGVLRVVATSNENTMLSEE